MNELKQNALLNSASHSPNSAKRFLRKRFRVNKLNLKTIVVLRFLHTIN
ncbi:hypothetical protein [Leptospira noguchii]|uniref:Uncharacterized protein n=1 Tax=Leptospira noguchii TaxID=28182 RepID=A0AAE9GDD0_9LEPT|nr:hypothetical protein [Leptospira noguchii]UOG57741.1 hypothetical protein MAL03_06325 [Leptospira noguchii]